MSIRGDDYKATEDENDEKECCPIKLYLMPHTSYFLFNSKSRQYTLYGAHMGSITNNEHIIMVPSWDLQITNYISINYVIDPK
jgi:hypothetical protein